MAHSVMLRGVSRPRLSGRTTDTGTRPPAKMRNSRRTTVHKRLSTVSCARGRSDCRSCPLQGKRPLPAGVTATTPRLRRAYPSALKNDHRGNNPRAATENDGEYRPRSRQAIASRDDRQAKRSIRHPFTQGAPWPSHDGGRTVALGSRTLAAAATAQVGKRGGVSCLAGVGRDCARNSEPGGAARARGSRERASGQGFFGR